VGGGTCFYWLHTHAAHGTIHIESSIARTFTLGDFFFDVGRQKLGPEQVVRSQARADVRARASFAVAGSR
jgi:hypothetical protein